MKIIPTAIAGVANVEIDGLHDSRGAFMRLFCEQELADMLDGRHIVQINHSRTSRVGAIRGMHYQCAPHAEMKMVRCLKGRVWDVAVELRYPHAIRPWQHVLEPLYGYILLAEKLLGADAAAFSDSWNFGPDAAGDATAGEIARKAADCWGSGAIVSQGKSDNLHEAGILRLDITKARTNLKWRPRWPIDRAVEETISWYKAWHGKTDNMHQFSLKQIESYEEGV